MAGKPVLHYFNGRGRMECIRWLLAAAGVEFEEKFIETPQDMKKLINDGSLMFQQIPMVEIDGMKLVQTRAILNYIASKYNLYGNDLKERALYCVFSVITPIDTARTCVQHFMNKGVVGFMAGSRLVLDLNSQTKIDMYTEGILDLTEMIMDLVICPPDQRDAKIVLIKDKTKNRYLPAFEKVLKSHGQEYLVGNTWTRVDIHLVELLLYIEELDASLLASFPLLKALKTRISNLPNVKKFLQPGSPRKPPPDEKKIAEARKDFNF